MATSITITPPGSAPQTIEAFDKCTVTLSATNRAGSFSLVLPGTTNDIIDAYPVGSDVQITQEGHLFRGWVLNPAKALDGLIRRVSLSGPDYTAKTQKIVVTESYIDAAISDIVAHLFLTYAPWAALTNVETYAKGITIKFADKFLWDAMEQLCELSGYSWYIDNNLIVNFFAPATRINANILSQVDGSYKKGSAGLTPNSSRLVNKLWVKGGKALSEDYTQNITVGATPIPLFYKPRATISGVVVTVGGAIKTIGIQNVTAAGIKDFLLNFEEKLLIPDLCTTGTGTIIYRYEYPMKLLLEEPNSQEQYGVFEDIINVDTNDRDLALELGLRHLAKYSQPVLSGGIQPFEGIYYPGELVKVEIPDLGIDDYLQIKDVTYDSIAGRGRVDRKLQLESPERDLPGILKDINQRLTKLEKQVYQDDEGPVGRYVARDEVCSWAEGWEVVQPIQTPTDPSEISNWTETITEAYYACPIPGDTQYPNEYLYPC